MEQSPSSEMENDKVPTLIRHAPYWLPNIILSTVRSLFTDCLPSRKKNRQDAQFPVEELKLEPDMTAAVYGGSLEKPTPLSTNVIDPCWQMDDHDLATVSMVNMRNKITERDEILRLMYGRLTPGGAVTVREFVWIPPSEVPSDRPDSKPAGKLLSHMDAQGEAKDLPLLAYPDIWRELKNAGFTGLQENMLGPYPVEGLIEKIEGIVKEQIDWEVLPFSDSRYEILSRVENDLKRTKLFI